MKNQHLFFLYLFLASFFLVAFPAFLSAQRAPARGYHSRPCGLDMNRNGIPGEPEDCQVCDGSTKDPDFDGILEDLIYVDCDGGSDSAFCGTPGSPCRSIQFAWNERGDGPGDGAEDIVCFRGTCLTEENTTIGSNGVAGTYIRPRAGSEAIDWEYPKNPTMLVGWDTDADGEYPPYDLDDTSVLDGRNLTRAFHISANGTKSYVEMAHFTARDYGRFKTVSDTGFLRLGLFGPVSSHGYLHDLELLGINRGRPSGSSISIFNLFRGGSQPRWWSFENILVSEMGSWLARGSAQNDSERHNGPYRFKNFSVLAYGCSFSDCGGVAAATMFKLWGHVYGIEILDSRFDLQPDVWEAGGNPSNGVSPAQCSRDWTIRNNEFIDFQRALNIQVTAEDACDEAGERSRVDNVIFDRNIWTNEYPRSGGEAAVKIEAGSNIDSTLEDLRVTNNIFFSSDPIAACLWSDAGYPDPDPTQENTGDNPGIIHFTGNTCAAAIDRFGAIYLNSLPSSQIRTLWIPQDEFVIQNNIFTGLSTDQFNVYSDYVPADFTASNNVYDLNEGEDFLWGDSNISLLNSWNGATGDENSRDCIPKFRSSNDYRLNHNDTCAVDHGTPIMDPLIEDLDVEGQLRGLGTGWDIGGDELSPPTFISGFESGDTSIWTRSIP